ncbi:hypothetical protein [Salirhabdus sp. Marseille-P4669]|uniref:hypothetical protein n=1 Tax=Salirhabdus sp. Marseille-P4669 TaxID=2042310 RepID=UPI001F2C3FC3|nr:hypothetical protein [Salirhabdus sp. Marseille-P4669]
MKSDLKINYGILEDIINQLHKYQGALGNMRDSLSNIDSFVETNYGKSIDAWKDKIKTSELNIKEYEIQIKDLLSLFENYVTDTTSIIYPLEKYTMMRVNRNNIKKNLREIESGMSNNVTKAFYRTLDDPPGNWKFWDDISDAEKEASRYNKGRIESISQDILNTKVRLDNKMAEMWKIYDSKVVPFENMDDEYKGKADVIKDKYTTFWEGFWDTFGILESAGDLFRGFVDFALDTVEGLIGLSEDAGIIIVSAIIPDAIEPDFLKQEAYDRLQPYKQALIQVIEDPKGVVENMVNSFTEMVDEEGMMYAIGYSGSSFIPMAGATKFTKLTKINDREAELKQYVDKTVKSNKSFEGVRLSPVEIVKNVRKFGSNLVNEVLGGMTVLKQMLDFKEVPVLSGISSKNINVFDTGYLKGKAKEFYSWFRANVVGNGVDFGKYSTIIDDKVKVIEKVDLPDWIRESFTDSNYRTVITEENITLYRTYGGGSKANGSFVTTRPAGNRINAKIDAALIPDWKNTREFEAVIEVPKGQILNIGRVEKQYTKTGALLAGDADQILLPQGWPSEWIKEIRIVPSK